MDLGGESVIRGFTDGKKVGERDAFAKVMSCLIVEGDTRGGFTIFYPDDGLDTGEILLTRS